MSSFWLFVSVFLFLCVFVHIFILFITTYSFFSVLFFHLSVCSFLSVSSFTFFFVPFFQLFFIVFFIYLLVCFIHCKKKKLSQLKIWRQPASADFWVFSTSCFKFIQQKVEKFPKKISWENQKSAGAGCLKILSWLKFFWQLFYLGYVLIYLFVCLFSLIFSPNIHMQCCPNISVLNGIKSHSSALNVSCSHPHKFLLVTALTLPVSPEVMCVCVWETKTYSLFYPICEFVLVICSAVIMTVSNCYSVCVWARNFSLEWTQTHTNTQS